MGHQQQRRPLLRLQGEEELHDPGTGFRIEIPGRLVSQQKRWARHEGPGQGDPLLLATGELPRVVMPPRLEADAGQGRCRLPGGIGNSGEFEGERDILGGGHRRDEVKGLENDADMTPPEAGQGVLVELGDIDSGDADAAGGRLLETGDRHQQGGLARPRGAGDTESLPGRKLQIDPAQDIDPATAAD